MVTINQLLKNKIVHKIALTAGAIGAAFTIGATNANAQDAAAAAAASAKVDQTIIVNNDSDSAAAAAASAKSDGSSHNKYTAPVVVPTSSRSVVGQNDKYCVVEQDYKTVRVNGKRTKVADGKPYWTIKALSLGADRSLAASAAGFGISTPFGGSSMKVKSVKPDTATAAIMCGGPAYTEIVEEVKEKTVTPTPVAATPAPVEAKVEETKVEEKKVEETKVEDKKVEEKKVVTPPAKPAKPAKPPVVAKPPVEEKTCYTVEGLKEYVDQQLQAFKDNFKKMAGDVDQKGNKDKWVQLNTETGELKDNTAPAALTPFQQTMKDFGGWLIGLALLGGAVAGGLIGNALGHKKTRQQLLNQSAADKRELLNAVRANAPKAAPAAAEAPKAAEVAPAPAADAQPEAGAEGEAKKPGNAGVGPALALATGLTAAAAAGAPQQAKAADLEVPAAVSTPSPVTISNATQPSKYSYSYTPTAAADQKAPSDNFLSLSHSAFANTFNPFVKGTTTHEVVKPAEVAPAQAGLVSPATEQRVAASFGDLQAAADAANAEQGHGYDIGNARSAGYTPVVKQVEAKPAREYVRSNAVRDLLAARRQPTRPAVAAKFGSAKTLEA